MLECSKVADSMYIALTIRWRSYNRSAWIVYHII